MHHFDSVCFPFRHVPPTHWLVVTIQCSNDKPTPVELNMTKFTPAPYIWLISCRNGKFNLY